MGTALTTQSVGGWLEKMKPEIEKALPSLVDVDQFVRVALTTMRKNPKLLECTQVSIAAALMTSAQLGLKCDGVLGQAYLVPYGRECTFIPGYKGLLTLARRSNEVIDINPECVYEGDTFEFQLGDGAYIKHSPGPNYGVSDDLITHVYVVVNLKGGGKVREVWPRKKIEAHRDQYCPSRNKKDSPWNTAFSRMAKKTVLRSIIGGGRVPVSEDVQRFASMEEMIEAKTVNGSVIRQDRPSLESLASELLGETEEAEIVDPSELLAKADDAIKSAATVSEAQAEYQKWDGRFSGEMAQHLEFVLASHCEYLEGGA